MKKETQDVLDKLIADGKIKCEDLPPKESLDVIDICTRMMMTARDRLIAMGIKDGASLDAAKKFADRIWETISIKDEI